MFSVMNLSQHEQRQGPSSCWQRRARCPEWVYGGYDERRQCPSRDTGERVECHVRMPAGIRRGSKAAGRGVYCALDRWVDKPNIWLLIKPERHSIGCPWISRRLFGILFYIVWTNRNVTHVLSDTGIATASFDTDVQNPDCICHRRRKRTSLLVLLRHWALIKGVLRPEPGTTTKTNYLEESAGRW